jgi:hypothetical protein
MLGCPSVVQDIAIPHLQVTIKVASHVMKGWQTIHLLIEAAYSIIAIVRIDVHKIDCVPHWVEQDDQDVAVIDDVASESWAQTVKAVMDVGHNARGLPPYHRSYNIQPVGVLRCTNNIIPMRVLRQYGLMDHLPGWLLYKDYIIQVLLSLE